MCYIAREIEGRMLQGRVPPMSDICVAVHVCDAGSTSQYSFLYSGRGAAVHTFVCIEVCLIVSVPCCRSVRRMCGTGRREGHGDVGMWLEISFQGGVTRSILCVFREVGALWSGLSRRWMVMLRIC